jgi:hypothetical protein
MPMFHRIEMDIARGVICRVGKSAQRCAYVSVDANCKSARGHASLCPPYGRFDVERMAPPDIAERLAQEVDVIDEKTQAVLSQIGREEKATAQMKFRR